MFVAYMRLVDWIVRRIDGHCDGGPIWRTKNNPQTLPMIVAAGVCAGVAVQTSSAPVATVAIILAVVLVAIIVVTRVAGVTGAQRRTWLWAAVVAIRSAISTRVVIVSPDTIVPLVEGDPTPHAGAPPGAERAPRPPHNTLIRCAVRRSKEAGHRVASLRLTIC